MTDTAVLPAAGETGALEEPEAVDQAVADHEARLERLQDLNPCRVCGSMGNAGPSGADHAEFEHCWKCGYRPGATPPVGAVLGGAAQGLNAAQIDRVISELRKGVVEDILAALHAGASPEEVSATYVPPDAAPGAQVAAEGT